MYERIAVITILSLTLLAVCCQILPSAHAHDTMQVSQQSMAHVALLAMSLPLSVSMAWISFALVALLLLYIAAAGPVRDEEHPYALSAHPPDFLYRSPLRSALADGILNPKVY